MTARDLQAEPAVPEMYASWLRAVRPGLDDEDVTRNWRGAAPSDRKFWTDLAAQHDKLRDLLDDFTHAVIDLDDGARIVAIDRLAKAARSVREKAGLPELTN